MSLIDVAVLGSLNVDMVFRCADLPKAGETLLCDGMSKGPGGKGLNQAVAASRAGARTSLIGAIGDDLEGQFLSDFLQNEDIQFNNLERRSDLGTGVAHIAVDRRGENSILVASGANKAEIGLPRITPKVRLTQLEVNLQVASRFLQAGKRAGELCILNGAPALRDARSLFHHCDVVVLNEHEVALFASCDVPVDNPKAITQAARRLIDRSDQHIIVTLGPNGTRVVSGDESTEVPANSVSVVDTTGAGDCFCGVLASSLAGGRPIIDAVAKANRAASLAVGRQGAACAMPTRTEIDRAV
jgi:ribokinase